jgi:hypothetical protein
MMDWWEKWLCNSVALMGVSFIAFTVARSLGCGHFYPPLFVRNTFPFPSSTPLLHDYSHVSETIHPMWSDATLQV